MRLPLLLAILVALGGYVWCGPTSVRQARWMAEAREQVPAVEAVIRSDPHFADCRVGVHTGGGILIVGSVRAESHLQDLKHQLRPIRVSGGTAYVVRVQ